MFVLKCGVLLAIFKSKIEGKRNKEVYAKLVLTEPRDGRHCVGQKVHVYVLSLQG